MGCRVLLLLFATVAFAPPVARADWRDFIPRPVENKAFLDLYTSYERDHDRSGTRKTRWEDTFVREKLTLTSRGFSYHPRFLQYRFSLSGIGKHENYDSNAVESDDWRHDSGVEYNARILVLPEHYYNLDAFSSRYEPVYKEQAASSHDSVAMSHGVAFRYRRKPYFVHTDYTDDTIDTNDVTSHVRKFRFDGEYFQRYDSGNEFSLSGGVHPSWFSDSEDLDGTMTDWTLGNFINLQDWSLDGLRNLPPTRLTSNASQSWFNQESGSSEDYDSDQFSWQERLIVELPWNFRTDLNYRYQDSESTIDERGGTTRLRLADTTNNLRLDVVHRLYESLDTTYTFGRDWNDSRSGESDTLTNALNLDYTKRIPTGRFMSGVGLSRSDTDNTGQADVLNEPYPAIPVPGSFVLRQQNVDPGSILVFLRSPLPPFEAILLEENVNYVVIPTANTFEIQIFSLPPQFVVPGTYDFFVTYSLETGDFELRTDSLSGNVSMELFNYLLTPYFSYLGLRSDVRSGTFPGDPIDSDTYTAGLIVLYGPLRLRGEYQKLDWDVAPYDQWRAELQYTAALNPTTRVYTTASYQNKHYFHGSSTYNDAAYTEQRTTAAGNIRKQLFSRSMFVGAGGTYSHIDGLVDSDAYSVNGSFTWRIGKMELAAGATAYAVDSKGTGTLSTDRDHQLFFLKVRRELF